jgi:putative membrane protein
MMRRIFPAIAMLAMLAGCKRSDEASEPRTTAAVAPAATGIAKEDREFIDEASQGGILEVELGNVAQQRASSAEVKAFGQHMVTDHSKANDELTQLASTKGVRTATELDSKHRKMVEDMQQLSGDKFDREYVDDMVEDHEQDVKAFEKASREARDPDLRSLASKTLPTLRMHLQMARDLKAKMKR